MKVKKSLHHSQDQYERECYGGSAIGSERYVSRLHIYKGFKHS